MSNRVVLGVIILCVHLVASVPFVALALVGYYTQT